MFSNVTQSRTFFGCITLNSPRKGWRAEPLCVGFQVFDDLITIDVTHLSQDPSNCRLNVVAVVIEAARYQRQDFFRWQEDCIFTTVMDKADKGYAPQPFT